MKTLVNIHQQTNPYSPLNPVGISAYEVIQRSGSGASPERKNIQDIFSAGRSRQLAPVLTEAAAKEMCNGGILNLEQICRELNDTFQTSEYSHSALQFIPILKKLPAFSKAEIGRFLENPKTSHVLVQNDQLKVVLIHWEPGKFSSIHGHAQGGCVFKVLKGRVQEKRYTPDQAQKLLAVSTLEGQSMAYIDDEMAYHAVGNPFNEPAISIHVYTPGR